MNIIKKIKLIFYKILGQKIGKKCRTENSTGFIYKGNYYVTEGYINEGDLIMGAE